MDILNALLGALDMQDNLEVSDIIKNKVPIVLDYYIEYFSKTLELIKSSQIN
ncbi:MAG TPA: hypothetical protein PLN23_01430 [Fervidobacterium sp.]|nr:hypothetical protein [Fervidobacterium sp.]